MRACSAAWLPAGWGSGCGPGRCRGCAAVCPHLWTWLSCHWCDRRRNYLWQQFSTRRKRCWESHHSRLLPEHTEDTLQHWTTATGTLQGSETLTEQPTRQTDFVKYKYAEQSLNSSMLHSIQHSIWGIVHNFTPSCKHLFTIYLQVEGVDEQTQCKSGIKLSCAV